MPAKRQSVTIEETQGWARHEAKREEASRIIKEVAEQVGREEAERVVKVEAVPIATESGKIDKRGSTASRQGGNRSTC